MRSMVEGQLAPALDPSTIHSAVNGSPPQPVAGEELKAAVP
jgi:hypothetical protein